MKTIPLTKGKVVSVDDEDYEELNKYKWCAIKDHGYDRWYAQRASKDTNGKYKIITMHRQIMGFPIMKEIDHVNRNGLDNRRCNLRQCNHSQNKKNNSKYKNNTSGLNGVCWNRYAKKWRASIYKDKKHVHIGYFNDKEEAGRAVDGKALELFGEFAVLNFPETKGE